MKAISLWEPWASLIRVGAKTYETRSWSTSYRGQLLICAAKKKDESAKELFDTPEFQKPFIGTHPGLLDGYLPFECLNFGKAVAIVELIRCEPTINLSFSDFSKEEMFGDYSPGRFEWKLRMINNKFIPFDVKGSQGFFEVDSVCACESCMELRAKGEIDL